MATEKSVVRDRLCIAGQLACLLLVRKKFQPSANKRSIKKCKDAADAGVAAVAGEAEALARG